jgi:hypothetical protein
MEGFGSGRGATQQRFHLPHQNDPVGSSTAHDTLLIHQFNAIWQISLMNQLARKLLHQMHAKPY